MKTLFFILVGSLAGRAAWEHRTKLLRISGMTLCILGTGLLLVGTWILEKGGAYCFSAWA